LQRWVIKLNHRSELKAEEASISERMANLDRLLTLVHLLADTSDGLTLDEMARELGISRRTAERMRAIVAHHFDLDESADDRKMRFRIRGSLRRVFTRPDAAEVAALQVEVNARRREKAPQSHLLESLLAKVKGALDDREKLRLEPDLEPLVRLQRTRVQPGPVVNRWRSSRGR
jgi:proteasome accessory factor B